MSYRKYVLYFKGVEEVVTEPERKENREGNESVLPMNITTSSQDQVSVYVHNLKEKKNFTTCIICP